MTYELPEIRAAFCMIPETILTEKDYYQSEISIKMPVKVLIRSFEICV